MHNLIVTRFENKVVNICIDTFRYIYCKVIKEGYNYENFKLAKVENIDKVKLASEASQENFAFLATKYEKIAKLEHLVCPKVGGLKPTCAPPTFESGGGGGHMPPLPPPPFSYALESWVMSFILTTSE